jgi:hypothetical protein
MRTLNGVPHSRLTHQLRARDITFTIDPSSTNFFQTRHGMAATAKIVLNGTHPVGTTTDFPEQVIIDVEFALEVARTALAFTSRWAPAQVLGGPDQSDGPFISEYARGLLQIAKQSLLQPIHDNPPRLGA